MCAAREYDVSPQQQYTSGDVDDNSMNSAHGHQPKGTTVLQRRYSLGRTRHSRAILEVYWCIQGRGRTQTSYNNPISYI